MSAYVFVRCDAANQTCPNRVEVGSTPDRLIPFVRDLKRAGWSRTRRGEFCPMHTAARANTTTSGVETG